MSANFKKDAKQRLTLSILLSSSFLLSSSLVNAAGDSAQQTVAAVTTPTSAAKPTSEAKPSSSSKDVLRLTKDVKPIAYELTIKPDLEASTYTGVETCQLTVASARKEIILHALEMNIDLATITTAAGKIIKAKAEMDPQNEQVKLTFAEEVPAGEHTLQLDFSAELNNKGTLRGFYRSYYKDAAGNKHWVANSQFEPSDARRMFPCFDEPEFKAEFTLHVLVDPKYTAISNAPIENSSIDGGKKLISFATSPKMSTYLLTLIIGEFSSTEMRKSKDVPIRVWAPTGQEKLGNYALGAACECMAFLEDYFGIKYPAKKLDLIALPDLAPGAMENFGAITFKDSLLLIDDKTGSNFARRSAFSVIAHEMAHQWFGDLVTMRWWDDLWLNEAFATWAATKTEATLRPEWRTRAKDMLDRGDAMKIDELASTRAIHAHVGNPKQASEMFDALTYDKGANVLRMLEVFVNEKAFQKGVHDYLEAHKFNNAVTDDLWKSIGAASNGVPVQKMMDTWIMQGGFPLVSDKSKTANSKDLTLEQERFLVMPGSKPDASEWIVPVMARSVGSAPKGDGDKSSALLLDSKTKTFTLPSGGTAGTSTVLNAGASGFYRVLYSQDALKSLLDKWQFLTPEERLSLMSDVAVLARKDLVPVEQSQDLMLKTKVEDDTIVLSNLVGKFAHLKPFMDAATKPQYEKFVCAYLQPLKKKYTWQEQKGESETVKDLRADVMKILGTCGQDKETITEARDLYNKYMKDKESVSPDTIASILSIVAYNGTEADYEQIRAASKKAANPQEEKRFLMALTDFRQPELVQKTLDLALHADTRPTDSVALMSSMLSNRDINEQAWKFTEANWDKLSKKFPPRFNKRIASSCSNFNTEQMETTLRNYFAAHPWEVASAAIGRALEEVHVSVLYRQRNEERIRKWVLKQAQNI